jgi:hypothetical protein
MIRQSSRHNNVERRATRMHEMIDRLGVDRSAIARLGGGDAFAQARARCLACAALDECLPWLDRPHNLGCADFCPNLVFFKTCPRRSPVA